MELLLQIFLEFLVQVVGGVLLDLILHSFSRVPRLSKGLNSLHTAFLFFVVGSAIGGFSILFFPQAFIRSSTLHGISLVITPTIAGLVMSAIGWFRLRQGKLVVHLESFSYGFIFAFGMALVRLLFTK
ncbi:MAG TPA: hypothetical protein VGP85_07445 [Pyrinomonadaceae bacterium]|jgi:hypothetical protein|nr:hypothetical protein [Pyrinomonadaceae bacterium]